MKKILVIHGPNLKLLGKREPQIYGSATIENINAALKKLAKQQKAALEVFQSDHEGEIVARIGGSADSVDAIVINPAAYTHTSVAIRDAISACQVPTVEVHLSNIYSRESFRHHSLVAPVAMGQISGFGIQSYELGFLAALDFAEKRRGGVRRRK